MNEDKIFRDIERLRDPQRLALLETERVVSLCLQGPKLEKVLDIGTGSGVFAEVFSHSGLNVTGIDLQEPMLEAARRFVPKAHFQMADSKALPFGDDSFDLCFLGLVLHEAGRPLLTLQEARRVCTMRTAVLEWSYTEQNFGPPLKDRLKSDEVLRMGNSAGFSQIKTIPMEHLILFLLEK
ncbi:MAG: class I SAM-dependent methyltransferase [Candidatus Aminicenantales bacterium]|jgi:ubiquinone/menaquinone biosynthesis C-methylase UbiE